MSEAPVCAKCDHAISTGVVVTAMEKKWHSHCFVCDKCHTELGKVSFMVRDDKPICIECQKEHFMPKCGKCDATIEPTEKYLTYDGKAYHSTCFICSECHESLAGKQFVIDGPNKKCQECAKL